MNEPKTPKRGSEVLAWANSMGGFAKANRIINVKGGLMRRTPSGTVIDVTQPASRKSRDTQPPLTVNIYKDGADWKIWAVDGRVVARSNAEGDAIGTLAISGLPTKASPETVLDGDKFTVKIDTNTDGQATAATWTKTADADPWPPSVATELAGGDTAGTVGVHYVRIASISESAEDDEYLNLAQLSTGHVDYFQPILCENAIVTAVTGRARILQRFRLTNGEWVFRTLDGSTSTSGEPIIIEEDSTKARIYSSGDTFIVNIWQTDITFLSAGAGALEIDNGVSPLSTFYVWKGIWFETEPTGFPAGATEYHVSYVTPTTGGPSP